MESDQTQMISFSQLKATIEGKLKCFQKDDCEDITISIRPVEQASEKNTIILGHFGNYIIVSHYMASRREKTEEKKLHNSIFLPLIIIGFFFS